MPIPRKTYDELIAKHELAHRSARSDTFFDLLRTNTRRETQFATCMQRDNRANFVRTETNRFENMGLASGWSRVKLGGMWFQSLDAAACYRSVHFVHQFNPNLLTWIQF